MYTVCPRSSVPFYIVIKYVNGSLLLGRTVVLSKVDGHTVNKLIFKIGKYFGPIFLSQMNLKREGGGRSSKCIIYISLWKCSIFVYCYFLWISDT